MNKKKIIGLLFFVFLFIIFGCGKSSEKIHNSTFLITDSINFDEGVDIGNFEQFNENYVIRDGYTGEISLINKKGETISSYLKKGQGPEELAFPLNFVMNDNDLFILDYLNKKIVEMTILDDSIKYVNERMATCPIADMTMIGDDIIVSTVGDENKLQIFTQSGEIMKVDGIFEQIPDIDVDKAISSFWLIRVIDKTLVASQLSQEASSRLLFFSFDDKYNFTFDKEVEFDYSNDEFSIIDQSGDSILLAHVPKKDAPDRTLHFEFYDKEGNLTEKSKCKIENLTSNVLVFYRENSIWLFSNDNDQVMYKLDRES